MGEIDSALANEVVAAVRAIGKDVRRSARRASSLERRQKSSLGDLVTSLDTSTEARLKRDLGPLFPAASFIGEESGSDGASAAYTWILDPIDGTTNVIHGVEYAAISVALVRSGAPSLGVVHDIFRGLTYFAIAREGAFVVSTHRGARSRLNSSPITALGDSLVSFGLPYDRARSDSIFQAAAKVLAVTQDLRRQGSAALDVIGVAAGKLDAHFELDLRVWDVAAASLILQEAGGRFSDWGGRPVNFVDVDARIGVLASNGHIHAEMTSLLES
jgi:myo-inositol-1(or 4)-monophosphatase